MQTINQYEIIDHGFENSQSFQDCGTSYTDFTDSHTGIGTTPYEAINDALESLALSDSDWQVTGSQLEAESETWNCDKGYKTYEDVTGNEPCEDMYYYVSIRIA